MNQFNINDIDKELIKQLGFKTKDTKFITDIVNFLDSDEEKEKMISLLKTKKECKILDIEKMAILVADKRIMDDIKNSHYK